MDVTNSQTSTAGSQAVEVFTVSGDTTVPFLYPGCVADLKMRKEDSNETTYFTKVMVTEAIHEIDTLGHYTGSFAAIAADTGFYPNLNLQFRQHSHRLPQLFPMLILKDRVEFR